LAEIEAATPWAQLVAVIEPHYPKGNRGRPRIGLERMLKMYIAQKGFGLSDEGIEDQLYDNQAIRCFVGIDLALEDAPDTAAFISGPRALKGNKNRQLSTPDDYIPAACGSTVGRSDSAPVLAPRGWVLFSASLRRTT
jgi:hypothetical protein